ncbi:MAG: pyruvate kinase alpha/beta domain-containing protein, partial [Verrucomicrobiota bacterium]
LQTQKQHTVKAAVGLADSLEDATMIIFTARGVLANYASQMRPANSPIFAFSPDATVVRSLNLNRSVFPFVMDFAADPEESIRNAIDFLRGKGLIEKGGRVVILSDVLNEDFDTESILLRHA